MLIDRFGRQVHYLRLSVTDRCDLRCVYCMSEKMTFLPREQLLTLEELAQVAQAFVRLGVDKIRLTGGEPLVRRNVISLIQNVGQLPLRTFALTTNGTQLPEKAESIYAAGINALNISLDTLQPERFLALSRVGQLSRVLAGIRAAIAAGFKRIKINAVILKNRNHDEIIDLIEFCLSQGIDISFIEEMPLGLSSYDRGASYYSSEQIRQDIAQRFALIESDHHTGGPSRYWTIAGESIHIGFISPHSHNFCDSCNRVRVTAEGQLLLCLGQEQAVDLRAVMRAAPNDADALDTVIRESMLIKPHGHDFNTVNQPIIMRRMSHTGG